MQAVSSELYAQAKQSGNTGNQTAAQQAPPPPAGETAAEGKDAAGKQDEGVIDADFEMVDDKK